MVQRAFRTAPTIQTAGYRSVNKSFEMLAKDHGLTNMNQRGGDGMRRVTHEQESRTTRAMEMIGHGDNAGQDMGTYFKPLSEFGSAGVHPSSLVKDPTTGRVVATDGTGGIVREFAPPKIIVAGSYDGSHAGLPQGDA
jgi:hypothetical protein